MIQGLTNAQQSGKDVYALSTADRHPVFCIFVSTAIQHTCNKSVLDIDVSSELAMFNADRCGYEEKRYEQPRLTAEVEMTMRAVPGALTLIWTRRGRDKVQLYRASDKKPFRGTTWTFIYTSMSFLGCRCMGLS